VADAWRSPRTDVTTDTIVVETQDGAVVAYADVTDVDGSAVAAAWVQLHPAHRARGIGSALLAWTEARAALTPARVLHRSVDGGDTAGHDLLRASGYVQVRTRLHLTADLADRHDAPSPAGVTIRSVRPQEEAAYHEVVRASFAEHFALTVPPFATWWAEWRADPMFDPDLFLLAEDADAGIVGIACDLVDGAVGWVGDLGVLPGWRGRGIGRALLGASFEAFRARGLRTARLNVDAENETGAADLYRSAGMREHRRFLVFEKPLREG
jgi:mycothiol synthase